VSENEQLSAGKRAVISIGDQKYFQTIYKAASSRQMTSILKVYK